MNASESLQALRRANPRAKAGFTESVEAAADAVRTQLVTTTADLASVGAPGPRRHVDPRRRLARAATLGVSLPAAVAMAVVLTVGSPGPGVATAAAAVKQAATVTAAAAERSGTAVVRITHNGQIWAGTTIRWRDAGRPPGSTWRPWVRTSAARPCTESATA
jgi:hypothetical protein